MFRTCYVASAGGLLQRINRDTQKVAMKCSYAVVDGAGVNVFKQPITDPGKTSKKGILTLERDEQDGSFRTVQEGKGNAEKVKKYIKKFKCLCFCMRACVRACV